MTPRKPPRRRASRLTTSARNGGTRAWGKFSKQVAREEPMCWLRLPGCTIRSTGADHILPVKTHPHLEFVRSNTRGSCAHCNLARRDTPVALLPKLRAKMLASGKYGPPAKPAKALGFFR